MFLSFNQASSTYSILTDSIEQLPSISKAKFQSSKFDLLNSDLNDKDKGTVVDLSFNQASSTYSILTQSDGCHELHTARVSIKQVRLTQF